MQVYLYVKNEQVGPYSEEQIQQLLSANEIPGDTPAWIEGMTEWSTVSAISKAVDSIPIPEAIPAPPSVAAEPDVNVNCRNRRVFGGIVDMCILPIVLSPALLCIMWMYPNYHETAYLGWLLCAPVVACFLSSRCQATPGMMLLGVIATTPDGGRLGFIRAFIRHIVSMVSLILLFGYFFWNFNSKRRTLHDMAVRSLVVRKPKEFSAGKAPWLLTCALFIPSIVLSIVLLGFTPVGQSLAATTDSSADSEQGASPPQSSASVSSNANRNPAPPAASTQSSTAAGSEPASSTPASSTASETSSNSESPQPPTDDSVSTVKDGTLDFDNTVKIGPALEGCSFLKNVTWKSIVTAQGRKVVEADAAVNLETYKNIDLGDGNKLPAEWVDAALKAVPGLQVNYTVQFELSQTDNGIAVGYSGYTVKGLNPETGKPIEQEIKDTDDSKSIKSIFSNTPDPQISALIIAFSQSKPPLTPSQPSP